MKLPFETPCYNNARYVLDWMKHPYNLSGLITNKAVKENQIFVFTMREQKIMGLFYHLDYQIHTKGV